MSPHLALSYLFIAAPYLSLFGVLFSLANIVLFFALRRRLARLALGRNGSIEETIAILARDMREAQTFRSNLEKYLKTAEGRMRRSIQATGMVRFNPFSGDGSGGNQSFCVAFIDERHSGVVLSTLYARDRVGIYAKPIESGTSTFELTDEEREAIEKAKKSIAEQKAPAA